MRSSIERGFRWLYANWLFRFSNISYSQNGEDLIIKNLFNRLRISKPTYLDIGANHPIYISNTYLLYVKGSRGVCVEPNSVLAKKFRTARPGDIVLQAGVAFNDETEATFYQFPYEAHGLSTFSKKEAEFWETTGNENVGKYTIERAVTLPLLRINNIIREHFTGHPNFISIDVEGLDLDILKTLDFSKYKPEVFCIECIRYLENNKEQIDEDILSFMKNAGYFVYADTHINTIFCRKDAYKPLI
jgi:FkbM family methyltransferase